MWSRSFWYVRVVLGLQHDDLSHRRRLLVDDFTLREALYVGKGAHATLAHRGAVRVDLVNSLLGVRLITTVRLFCRQSFG